ncbi:MULTISPECIES: DUF1853 family protein [unclassified Halomonas]|uniref:DUF1853 family protein n=1 Tax=unclassified Halomonas TaxID=2609666 RepID=UPI0009908049|nr:MULTISPECIES: DUF1853 family protein [unclassified Halomonas]AQU84786.1 hypothetical protein B2G49_20625 [Halomonas sp. 'Soap Lake \
MTHRSEQSEHVPAHLTSQTARDLAWLLTTPDVVELPPPMPCGGRPTQQELGLQDDVDKWLAQLAPLISTLDGKLGTRMGHYHERLWHLLLDNAPNTRLLASNVKITHKRTTLGELDMLYRTRGNPAPVHLEVAIKFYLGLPEGPGDASSQSRWIGPGGLDSLALKCSHLRRHQLPISSTATALAIIAHWLAPRDLGPTPSLISQLTQRLAMPGVLFYPWHTEIPPPIGATANHRRGLWCHLKDWPALAAERSAALQMAWLEKPHWLAPPPQGAFNPTSEEIARVRPLIERYGPQQVMLYNPTAATTTKTITKTSRERHMERLIIVPNDWPRQVPLPPYTRD